jgi:malyl-CoA/(S)-citramalyl-CoA lyase
MQDKPVRVQRSELAVPATRPKFFIKAAAGPADVVFLDLEDAVAPSQKDAARAQAIEALNQIDWGTKTMVVRVNGLDTPWALEDIVEVARHAPRLDLVLLPKAGSVFDVQFVAQVLTLVERQTRRARRIGIEVLIETALGVANVEQIAQASDRLEAMIFGVGDYTVEMCTHDRVFGRPSERYAVLTDADDSGQRERHWNDQWHFAMARIANACRAWGLRPVDGPFTDFGDAAGFRASAQRAKALGFEGKWAIHPSQIELANQAFSPSAEELAWAARTCELIERTTRAGQGAVGADGVLVDMAHLKLANSIQRRQALIDSVGPPSARAGASAPG